MGGQDEGREMPFEIGLSGDTIRAKMITEMRVADLFFELIKSVTFVIRCGSIFLN